MVSLPWGLSRYQVLADESGGSRQVVGGDWYVVFLVGLERGEKGGFVQYGGCWTLVLSLGRL